MSFNVFIAVCVLGIDFLIYVLFQWTYGDKRREMTERVEAHRKVIGGQANKPFVVRSGMPGAETQLRIQLVRERMAKAKPGALRAGESYNRRMA
jgi:hypothetical protein